MNYGIVLESGPLEWALAAAATAALGALWPTLRRLPRSLAALRLLAMLLLAGAILKPVVHLLSDRVARPRVAVVIDQGPSMRSADDRGVPRLARAVRWLKRHRRLIEERAEPVLFGASGGARRVPWEELDGLEPEPSALDPASVFSDVTNAGPPVARVWLLSDGAFESGEELEPVLARVGAPVDAFGVGPLEVRRSVGLTALQSPDFVFIHSRFPVSAAVEAHRLEGGEVRLRLRKGGVLVGEKSFAVTRPYEMIRATFTVEADALGRQEYRFEVDAGDAGDRVKSARDFGVEVIRQKYRIMYLAGRPSFEYSQLRAQLKGDPNHELVSFVILRNPEDVSPVPDSELSLIPFPATEIFVKNLFQFDLFILENFAFWRFNLPKVYLQNLKRFVAQGGALLVIGGSNAFTKGGYQGTPLEETLPVTLLTKSDDFVPGVFRPTVASPRHPLLQLGDSPEATAELWSVLPPLDGFTRFSAVRPGASVLLAHPTEKTSSGQPLPVIAVREFGRGKVMLVGTESTWRWKLGGGRNWKISSFFGRFWSRAVQYLTGSLELKKVKFSPLPDRMPAREPAVLSLHVFDEHFRAVSGEDVDLRLVWTGPDGASKTPAFFEREPGVFQVELTDLAEGAHRVRAVARYRGQFWGEDVAGFRWEAAGGEAPLNRRRLKELAERTGGRYSDLHLADDDAELGAWLDTLPPVRRERTVRGRRHVWAWSGWLWALAGVLLLEWLMRRRLGYL
ncbi:MAG: glutamine amidotransferase [Elusimicrobiota bacterium]